MSNPDRKSYDPDEPVYSNEIPQKAIPSGLYIGADGFVYQDRHDRDADRDSLREQLSVFRELQRRD